VDHARTVTSIDDTQRVRVGLMVLAIVGVVALACLVLYLWRRRVEAERERAWIGSFSFGDVVARRRAREAADLG
jgi:hypothetical protein